MQPPPFAQAPPQGQMQPMHMQPHQMQARQVIVSGGQQPPAEDLTCLKIGTVLACLNCPVCGCAPCVGGALYMMNADAPDGSEKKQWANIAGVVGCAWCCILACSAGGGFLRGGV